MVITIAAYAKQVILVQRLVDGIRNRFHQATRELAKFGIIGAVNTLVDFGLWNLLIETVMQNDEVKAKILSSLTATTSAYFMNRHWTFRHRSRNAVHREYVLFFFFNAVGLGIQALAIFAAKYGFDVTDRLWLNVVNFGSLGVGTLFRFWAYRRFVWLKPTETPASSAGASAAPSTSSPPETDQPTPENEPAASMETPSAAPRPPVARAPAEANASS